LRDADQSTESPVGVGAIPIPSWPICTPIGRTVRRPTSGICLTASTICGLCSSL